jgi:hypothetical protein
MAGHSKWRMQLAERGRYGFLGPGLAMRSELSMPSDCKHLKACTEHSGHHWFQGTGAVPCPTNVTDER